MTGRTSLVDGCELVFKRIVDVCEMMTDACEPMSDGCIPIFDDCEPKVYSRETVVDCEPMVRLSLEI